MQSSIEGHNCSTSGLSKGEIRELDCRWVFETKGLQFNMINRVLGNSVSDYLKKTRYESDGLFTNLFFMDKRGSNVG